MNELFSDPALRTVSLGTAAIGGLAGFIGTFAVVRRQSLLGDAISHAALPGIGLAFLLGARTPALLIVGAAVSGWIAIAIVSGLVRGRRASFDTALGGTLAVFFGVGLSLMTWIKREVPGASQHGLERYLFGQAATMRSDDLESIAIVAALTVGIVALLWKQIKLVCFDPDCAAVQGWPVRWIDGLIALLIVLAVVVGLQAVGVVLMSALLVAPTVAAKPWCPRLAPLAVLSGAIGAASGVVGTVASHVISTEGRSVPTGPLIVLGATLFVAVSLTVASIRTRIRRRAASR